MANYNVARRPDGRWRARYRAPDGKERSKHFDRKADAERWARGEVAKVDRGDWTDPTSGKVSVGEYGHQWLASKVKIKPSTYTTYESLLRQHVEPTWGSVALAGVR